MSVPPPNKKARTTASSDTTHSDLTLKFSGQKREVQRDILCSKSGWFDTALSKEATSDTIVLEDDDPEALGLMLDFCCGATMYTICSMQPEEPPATLHARLYQVADEYDVPTLKAEVETWFKGANFKSCTNSDQNEALSIFYQMPSSSTKSVRTSALKSLRLDIGDRVSEAPFRSLITANPLMAVDILSLLGQGEIGMPLFWFECNECGENFALFGASYDKEHSKVFVKLSCPLCAVELESWESTEEYYI